MLAANTVHAMRQQDLTDLGYDTAAMSRQDQEAAYRIEQRQGHVKGDLDLFRAAGNMTRDWLKDTTKNLSESGKEQTALEKREERKRKIETPPAARAAKADLGEPEKKSLTPSQIVQQQRKARGLPI
jgi:hypothetical protein